jgi:hypothetical protein
MKRLILYVFIIGFVLIGSSAFAGSISGSPGATWRTWDTTHLGEDNNPYWDGDSWDGSQQNIGYLLTNPGGPGAIDYWGNSDGTADPDFYFKLPSPAYDAVIKFEIAGFKDDNTFGWYEVIGGTTHELYDGPADPGSMVSFSPLVDYGYYLTTPQGHTFYTQSSRNLTDTGIQHFAVFRDPTDYSFWIGVEDLLSGTGYRTDLDYNDFGVRINPVPEPAAMLLLGSGLIVIAGVGRKKILKKRGPRKS